MVEREPVYEKEISFEGYFDTARINFLIDNYLRERTYDKHDLRHEEQALPEGRQINIVKEPYKNITHYTRYVLKVELTGDHIKPVKVKGKDLEEGSISIKITAYLHMDWQGRWTGKPFFWMIARFMDKVMYKWYTNQVLRGLKEDMDLLYDMLTRYLNTRW